MGLIAYGVSGLVLIGTAAGLVLASLSAVNDAATGFERQRTEVLAMLGPASKALGEAASSASNAGASLTETRDAATRAAQLTARLADSFESLASLGSFELLGARPFGAVAGQFAEVGTEARLLSADLAATALAMDTNVADSAAVAASLQALADQLADLEDSLGPAAGTGTVRGSPVPGTTASPTSPQASSGSSTSLPVAAAGFVLFGLLVWLAVPAVGSIWLGWRWARPRRG